MLPTDNDEPDAEHVKGELKSIIQKFSGGGSAALGQKGPLDQTARAVGRWGGRHGLEG